MVQSVRYATPVSSTVTTLSSVEVAIKLASDIVVVVPLTVTASPVVVEAVAVEDAWAEDDVVEDRRLPAP